MKNNAAMAIPTTMRAEEFFDFGGLGVNWKIDGSATGERFAVVHHPMAPHALAAPLHRHHWEEGRILVCHPQHPRRAAGRRRSRCRGRSMGA